MSNKCRIMFACLHWGMWVTKFGDKKRIIKANNFAKSL
jgi:hypothetical protein